MAHAHPTGFSVLGSVRGLLAAALVTALVVPTLTGCSSDESRQHTPAVAKADDATATQPASEEAEAQSAILTDEAERLVDGATFLEAVEKFKKAQELNPANLRAQFWSKFLAPIVELKGALGRIRPIYGAVPRGEVAYNKLVANVSNSMPSAWQHYFLRAPADIQTPEQFQELVDRVILRLTELREWIEKNKNETLRLRLSNFLASGWANWSFFGHGNGGANGCVANLPSGSSFRLPGCERRRTPDRVLVNRADFEGLKYMVTSMEAYFTLLNAYRIHPEAVRDAVKRQDPLSESAPFNLLREISRTNSLPLRSRTSLTRLLDHANDLFIATQYAKDNKPVLCPEGREAKRTGNLVPFGICISETKDENGESVYTRTIRILQDLTDGAAIPMETIVRERAGTTPARLYRFEIYVRKLLEDPPDDLTRINPMTFDRCNNVLSLNEQPLVRYLKAGSINELLRLEPHTCPLETRP